MDTDLSDGRSLCSCLSKDVGAAYSKPDSEPPLQLFICTPDLVLDFGRLLSLECAAELDFMGGRTVGSIVSLCAIECLEACRCDSKGVLDEVTRSVLCQDDRMRSASSISRRQVDVYCVALQCTASIEALLGRCLCDEVVETVILKDVLNDKRLLRVIPQQLVAICKYIFLPAHLNFRNLIWHGFMAPHEVKRSVVALCLILDRTLRRVVLASPLKFPKQRIRDFSPFKAHFEQYVHRLDCLRSLDTQCLVRNSLFAVQPQASLYTSAFDDFEKGRYLNVALKLIPCIEHGLRLIFSICNEAYEFMLAWHDAYFSTLDGFGQRSKHQLLLDYDLNSYNDTFAEPQKQRGPWPNRLLQSMDSGIYAALVDLFFTDGGPNVRSAFAHGEYDCSFSPLLEGLSSQRDCGLCGLREIAAVLVSMALSLLSYYRADTAASRRLLDQLSDCPALSMTSHRYAEGRAVVMSLVSHVLSVPQSLLQPLGKVISVEHFVGYRSKYHINSIMAHQLKLTLEEMFATSQFLANRSDLRTHDSRCTRSDHRSQGRIVCTEHCDTEALVSVPVEGAKRVLVWENTRKLHQILQEGLLEIDDKWEVGAVQPNRLKDYRNDIIEACAIFSQALSDQWRSRYCVVLHNAIRSVSDQERIADSTAQTPELSSELSACIDGLLDVIGSSPVAFTQRVFIRMFPACLQLTKDLRGLCTAIRQAIWDKEMLLQRDQSHSSDRRQFLTYITCVGPVILELVKTALEMLVCHLFCCGEIRTVSCSADISGPRQLFIKPPCIKALCALAPSVGGCLPFPVISGNNLKEHCGISSCIIAYKVELSGVDDGKFLHCGDTMSKNKESGQIECRNNKKPVDKIFKQILKVLKSKAVTNAIGNEAVVYAECSTQHHV